MRSALLAASAVLLLLTGSDHGLAGEPTQASTGGWQTIVLRAETASAANRGPAVKSVLRTGSIRKHRLEGLASYYRHGEKTASGERFDKRAMTAAHPTLPFNSLVRVTDRKSGNSVVVRINDRGPFVPGRVIDLSEAAAEAIGMTRRGLTPVSLEVLADSHHVNHAK